MCYRYNSLRMTQKTLNKGDIYNDVKKATITINTLNPSVVPMNCANYNKISLREY
jgi:hypothetical protein